MWFNPAELTKTAKASLATLATSATNYTKVAKIAEVAISHNSTIAPLHDHITEWIDEPGMTMAEHVETPRRHPPEASEMTKVETLLDRQQEDRRMKALAILEATPETLRGIYVDTDSDPHNVIVAVTIRHRATCEMNIPKATYDPWRLLELIERMETEAIQSTPFAGFDGTSTTHIENIYFQKIRAWLSHIEEKDPEIIASILKQCSDDEEALAYFVGRAEEDL